MSEITLVVGDVVQAIQTGRGRGVKLENGPWLLSACLYHSYQYTKLNEDGTLSDDVRVSTKNTNTSVIKNMSLSWV